MSNVCTVAVLTVLVLMGGLNEGHARELITRPPGIVPPNTSLATVPVAYFGGNAAYRGDANIEMLAKMRLVQIEKWE